MNESLACISTYVFVCTIEMTKMWLFIRRLNKTNKIEYKSNLS